MGEFSEVLDRLEEVEKDLAYVSDTLKLTEARKLEIEYDNIELRLALDAANKRLSVVIAEAEKLDVENRRLKTRLGAIGRFAQK